MGLVILILGLAIFLGVHVFMTLRDTRAVLVARLGVRLRVLFRSSPIAGSC